MKFSKEELEEILTRPGYELEPVKMRKRPTKERGRGARKRPLADSKRSVTVMGKYTRSYAMTVLEPAVERYEIIGWKFIDSYMGSVPVHFLVYQTSGNLLAITIDNEMIGNQPASDMAFSADFWNGPRMEYLRVVYKRENRFYTYEEKPEMTGILLVGDFTGSRSKTETLFHNRLESLLATGSVECFIYEPCPVRYPGITYTPDYAVWEVSQTIYYEVKSGRDVMHSRRSSSIMMRVMGGQFQTEQVNFMFATYKQGDWVIRQPPMMNKFKSHPQLK